MVPARSDIRFAPIASTRLWMSVLFSNYSSMINDIISFFLQAPRHVCVAHEKLDHNRCRPCAVRPSLICGHTPAP